MAFENIQKHSALIKTNHSSRAEPHLKCQWGNIFNLFVFCLVFLHTSWLLLPGKQAVQVQVLKGVIGQGGGQL